MPLQLRESHELVIAVLIAMLLASKLSVEGLQGSLRKLDVVFLHQSIRDLGDGQA